MSKVIEINDLVKIYGNKKALDSVSFSVEEGTCFGLLGPNGAGKSTTMKILTSIIDGDGGTAKIFGIDVSKDKTKIRRQIGYVPQEITLYDKISAYNNLVFFGELYGVRGQELKNRIEEVLEQVGLSDRAKDDVKNFSGGMKRRINMAAALLHKPKVLILDEPTVGVDPQSRNHIFEMIRHLRDIGVTIVYSTHYMEEVEALCDDIAIIDNGQVLTQGPLEHLLENYGTKSVYFEAENIEQLPTLENIKNTYSKGKGWVIETDFLLGTMQDLINYSKDNKIKVRNLGILYPSLETVFLNLTGTELRN